MGGAWGKKEEVALSKLFCFPFENASTFKDKKKKIFHFGVEAFSEEAWRAVK